MTNSFLRAQPFVRVPRGVSSPLCGVDGNAVVSATPRHGALRPGAVAALAALVAGLAFGRAHAADPTWIGASGNWSDTANWVDGVVPGEGDTVRVSNTVANITINLDSPAVKVKAIRFDGHTSPGDVTVTGGKLILTSNANSMPVVYGADGKTPLGNDWNNRYYHTAVAAIVAYPYGVDFQAPVEFASTGVASVMGTSRDIHFRKAVTAPNVTTFHIHCGIQNDQLGYVTGYLSKDVYFHDSFTMPKANVTSQQTPTGNIYFYGPSLEVDKMSLNDWTSSQIRLMTTNTVMHTAILSPMYYAHFQSEVAGSYPTNTVVHFRKNTSSEGDDFGASVDLGFVDRTFDRLTSAELAMKKAAGYAIRSCANNQGGVSCSGTAPTTLTLRGTADAVTEGRICDDITVVWDPVGDFTQTFSNRTHTTKGSFVVKGGTMRLNGAGSIAAARALEIAAGATFELDSTIADALPRDLIVTSASRLKLNGATVHVKRLVVDGAAQADGTYAEASWLSGEGAVVVAADGCCTWVGKSGDWSDAANWLGGKVPSSPSDSAILDAQTDEDLTITVASDIAAANFPGVLEVVNRGSGTTTVRIAASVDASDGFVRVGRHARLEVPREGAFYYETKKNRDNGTATSHSRCILSVVDGGVWRTCGGTAVFTNICGQCWVNGAGSKLEVSDGLHLYTAWNSAFPLSIGTGARLELTGGTLYQPHEGWNQDTDLRLFGGTADFSGGVYKANVACVGPGSWSSAGSYHSTGSDLGYGTVLHRGTADVQYAGTITLRSFFGGTHLDYVVTDQPKLYGLNYLIGGRRYGDATVTVWDRPKGDSREEVVCGNYYLGGIYYNRVTGADAGDGRLCIKTGGYLATGFAGVFVGAGNCATQPNLTPLYQRGYLRVEPNAVLTVRGSTHKGYTADRRPNGLNVGLGQQIQFTSGRPCEGLAEVAGFVTNRVNFTVGGWLARGTYVQEGGATLTGWANDASDRGVTAVGYAGGEGSLLVSNGVFTSQQSVWVGGCQTNDFVVSGDGGAAQPNHFVTDGGWPIDNHGAEGLLEVTGGDFATTKNLYVGADGTGVVSVVGSSGSFAVAQDLVLSNQSASVVRFTADAAGVKPIAVGGRLVVTPGARLDVDLTACPDVKRVKIFALTGEVEGSFDAVNITPLDRRRIVRRSNGLYVANQTGVLVIVR